MQWAIAHLPPLATPLPSAYKVQMLNALEHLCHLNSHDFIIKPRTSFIFTGEDDEDIGNEINENNNRINDKININCEPSLNVNTESECIDESDEEHLSQNEDVGINTASTRTEELLKLANEQQRFLTNFFRQYPAGIMRFEELVNGLAGSGKSYVISIIEEMLSDFCISESAIRNRPRRRKGLLKLAHTGKAALNILGWIIHSALGMRPDNTSTPNNAPSFKIHSLRNRLGDLILIIIDEISLVSHSLFQKVNKRLNEIFEVSDKSGVYFGNIPVLLFGDLAQCEPVAAKQIFWRAPGETFSLWADLF
ncbi:unnamed protein product [Adineta steineri]|uniref:ATP-dependent DNA helicase n=1 Tax=Adineta steineri TaxID=433720 RepID=A0A819T672_9BILA|nr:unnamed protein product [Adineta steineri]